MYAVAVSPPYASLKRIFWNTPGIQGYIPFLGAGVSRSASGAAPKLPAGQFPDRVKLDGILNQLGLAGSARVLAEWSLLVACRMQAAESSFPDLSAEQLLENLEKDEYPPSAATLALLCSKQAGFTTLKEVEQQICAVIPAHLLSSTEDERRDALRVLTALTRVSNPPDPLSSIAGYHEKTVNRGDLWNLLHSIIAPKEKPTPVHCHLAEIAQHHLRQPAWTDKHYLILTTNYDRLMELALDNLQVPYVVLLNRPDQTDVQKPFFRTVAEFSACVPQSDKDLQEQYEKRQPESHLPASADRFVLRAESRLAVVYKIHGSLGPQSSYNEDGDEIIISENDYVNFMSLGNPIPSDILTPLKRKPLLFLGYSLNDWNVRSIFQSIRRKRANPKGDMCINDRYRTYEEMFFDKNDVNRYQGDLNDFVEKTKR